MLGRRYFLQQTQHLLKPIFLTTMYHCCPAKIGPSVLDCDLACLADEAKKALKAGATCK